MSQVYLNAFLNIHHAYRLGEHEKCIFELNGRKCNMNEDMKDLIHKLKFQVQEIFLANKCAPYFKKNYGFRMLLDIKRRGLTQINKKNDDFLHFKIIRLIDEIIACN